MMALTCPVCGQGFQKAVGEINRARRAGYEPRCSRQCAGRARRSSLTPSAKKALKAEYDREYRKANYNDLRRKRAEYHQRTYDPAKAAEARKARMPWHTEYCRRPEYRKWKAEYDRKHRAIQKYGAFAECFLLAQDIRAECLSIQTDYEIRLAAGTLNKHLSRRRHYERTFGNQPEIGALGDA